MGTVLFISQGGILFLLDPRFRGDDEKEGGMRRREKYDRPEFVTNRESFSAFYRSLFCARR